MNPAGPLSAAPPSQSISSMRDRPCSPAQVDASVLSAAVKLASSPPHTGCPWQTPFASCEVQQGHSQSQLQEPSPPASRKRARGQSAELDSNPLTKLPHVGNRQQTLAAGVSPDQSTVTLHKPTPHRPSASTPCCFGVVSATQPLQHTHLRSSGFSAARQSPGRKPAACTGLPSSLLPAAALADAVAAGKSSGSSPSDDDKASPKAQEQSQECRHWQGQCTILQHFAWCNMLQISLVVQK